MNNVHGVIHVHSCPVALAPHVAWTLGHILGSETHIEWGDQPREEGSVCATVAWTGPSGSAARFASALRGWDRTRFEVWESTTRNRDGVRYVHTPSLGIFFTLTDAAGNAMVGEDRVRYAIEMARGDATELEHELSLALGAAWDEELEPYRRSMEPRISVKRQVRAGARSI
ncbi:unannotated protein [freshwater metagenome]|jgi:hypothetical protein|uniref:Unannotated protein n=1 Tax=freshwater metagenome TaxID=449393 RepID=A0A6J6IBD7_9ZZZZ|nr:DUF3145 family protein [Actinomycetota bacterium]MUH52953.1 DUF3145 family protein [Actinomycetota bacterium]